MQSTLKILSNKVLRFYLSKNFNHIVFISLLLLFSFKSFAQNEYEYPLIKTEVDSIKKSDKGYWYADKTLEDFDRMEKMKSKPYSRINKEKYNFKFSIPPIIIYLFLGALGLFAIYVIAKNLKDFKFTRNEKVESTSHVVEDKDLTNESIQKLDFQTQIEKCILEKNYKLAIRYYYLWIVKRLDESNLIEFDIDKTNHDYIRELKTKEIFGIEKLAQFKNCTLFYEYAWFGNFELNEASFIKLENTFKDFINQRL